MSVFHDTPSRSEILVSISGFSVSQLSRTGRNQLLFLAGARAGQRYVPFLRIARGSFAFDCPTVLGATEDVGVYMGGRYWVTVVPLRSFDQILVVFALAAHRTLWLRQLNDREKEFWGRFQ